MSKSKLAVCEMVDGERYYVRKIARTLQVAGPIYNRVEDAFEQLRKCEADDEYLYWQLQYQLGNVPNPREERRTMSDMTRGEKMVLDYLFDRFDSDTCVQTFKSLSEALEITERQAKTACRRLKRRGYAEHSPYWDSYDGLLGGSGYTISLEGIGVARQRAYAAKRESEGSAAAPAASLSTSG